MIKKMYLKFLQNYADKNAKFLWRYLMKIYSYVVKHDSGFAPNPFWGSCTLATCKPEIRRKAKPGDWVIGTGSVNEGRPETLIYAMKVSEATPIEEYGISKKFSKKIPKIDGTPRQKCGDNIYFWNNGKWDQKKNPHHIPEDTQHDTNGKNVLIGKEFYYFGGEADILPARFKELIKKGPGHKCNFPEKLKNDFINWLKANCKKGINGLPFGFDKDHKTTCKK